MMGSKIRSMSFCDVCAQRKTVFGCFFCERPICGNCSGKIEFKCGVATQPGDRLCSKRCAVRYKREKREEGAYEEHLKLLKRKKRRKNVQAS